MRSGFLGFFNGSIEYEVSNLGEAVASDGINDHIDFSDQFTVLRRV